MKHIRVDPRQAEKLPKVTADAAYGGTKEVLRQALVDRGLPFEYGLSGLLTYLDRQHTQLRDEQAHRITLLLSRVEQLKALL